MLYRRLEYEFDITRACATNVHRLLYLFAVKIQNLFIETKRYLFSALQEYGSVELVNNCLM